MPRAEAGGVLGLCPVLGWKVRAFAPKGCSPRAILEGSVGGSFGWEPFTPGLNIPLCYDLVKVSKELSMTPKSLAKPLAEKLVKELSMTSKSLAKLLAKMLVKAASLMPRSMAKPLPMCWRGHS